LNENCIFEENFSKYSVNFTKKQKEGHQTNEQILHKKIKDISESFFKKMLIQICEK
jgi:hypothetical protein